MFNLLSKGGSGHTFLYCNQMKRLRLPSLDKITEYINYLYHECIRFDFSHFKKRRAVVSHLICAKIQTCQQSVYTCVFLPVAKNGDVCISILHEPGEDKYGYEKPEERWLPIHTVETIMISVISMLADPNGDSPANVDAAVSTYRLTHRCSQAEVSLQTFYD